MVWITSRTDGMNNSSCCGSPIYLFSQENAASSFKGKILQPLHGWTLLLFLIARKAFMVTMVTMATVVVASRTFLSLLFLVSVQTAFHSLDNVFSPKHTNMDKVIQFLKGCAYLKY